jgi:hypothetical protein
MAERVDVMIAETAKKVLVDYQKKRHIKNQDGALEELLTKFQVVWDLAGDKPVDETIVANFRELSEVSRIIDEQMPEVAARKDLPATADKVAAVIGMLKEIQ